MKPLHAYLKDPAKDRISWMHPLMVYIMCDVIGWCELQGIAPVFTDTFSCPSEDKALKRVSSTHRTGRAFDVSLHGWPEGMVEKCVDFFNIQYKHVGATSAETGEKRAVYLHDAGTGLHLHFQIAAEYALQEVEF